MMIRIVALNEDRNDNELEEEVVVRQEAQESIAESEYVRALKLKSEGKREITLSLLNELLETKVLSEISRDINNRKLWNIRYNCHKNIALIYEEKEEIDKALQHYILALEIDNSDVYTVHRFGQLALRIGALELAEYAFENCLFRNPSHLSAADGLLQTLCQSNNIQGAYGLALKYYRMNPNYARASRILREVMTRFTHLIPYFDKFWGPCSINIADQQPNDSLHRSVSVFPEPIKSHYEELNGSLQPNLRELKVKVLGWYAIGQYIVSVYQHLESTKQSMLFTLRIEDIINENSRASSEKDASQDCIHSVREESSTSFNSNSCEYVNMDLRSEVEANSQGMDSNAFVQPTSEQNGSKSQTSNVESNNEDSDSNTKTDNNDVAKPKPRRRCSDLHFLEQWGWHKTRQRRRQTNTEKTEVDTSLNGFLRKIFSKFTQNAFENSWPFDLEIKSNEETIDGSGTSTLCVECESIPSIETFDEETQTEFVLFFNELRNKPMDMMVLIYKWLKYISKLWSKPFPQELKILYLDIFQLYLKHFDFGTWNQLSNNKLEASFRICLLFLELEYDKYIQSNSDISEVWKRTFRHLTFNSGCAYVALGKQFTEHNIRMGNIEHLTYLTEHQLEKSVVCLNHMAVMLENESETFVLHLPNLKCSCITRSSIQKRCTELQRQIGMNKVPTLFESECWAELVDIISANILQSKMAKESINGIQNFKLQIEILLQSLWNMNIFEECLLWAEKFLHYIVCQYIKEAKNSYRQKLWCESINFVSSYIEAVIINEGFDIVSNLKENLPRLVQNIMRILSYQHDEPYDKNCTSINDLDTKRPWVILHQILLREENHSPVVVKVRASGSEDDDDLIPNSFAILFTGHEFLGKRQWCMKDNGGLLNYILDAVTPNLRAPLFDVSRDSIYEYVEQITFCLYGYPQKKARSRHLEDHDATPTELTWPKAMQIFDLYRPENLPEFNSYKLESISADMEQLLLKIIALVPNEFDPTAVTDSITNFINGNVDTIPEDLQAKLPFKIRSIYYLLGDYYFKNRDFSKAIKYYTLDLVGNPERFDSWAGMALSKASKIETKLNGLLSIDLPTMMVDCEDTIRCFERCISLNQNQMLLWIEYGSFSYSIHAYCSRYLKQFSTSLTMEQFAFAELKKKRMLTLAYNCFSFTVQLQNTVAEYSDENGECHEEKWLCQYMLGKISEKQKSDPKIYLSYYLSAANFLYENNATYPIKLNHNNPTTLSVEALEVFYRVNSAIIKYLEREQEVSREVGNLFNSVLVNLANSPFAFNKAKIDGNSLNALKRKIADKMENAASAKCVREADDKNAQINTNSNTKPEAYEQQASELKLDAGEDIAAKTNTAGITENKKDKDAVISTTSNSTSRRESQESGMTGTTTTVTSTATSTTSSSESSLSESETDSDGSFAESEMKKARDKNAPFSAAELDIIYRTVVRNLEECVTRFPEHYKSIYRLVYHYMHGPTNIADLHRCEELLLGHYKTNLGNHINGLFYDRKSNNLFNGIWRIPSSEIDRPGSFSAHLAKCVTMLLQLLLKTHNYKLMIDIGLQLYRTPDYDKRYIKDDERMVLFQQSVTFSSQILRSNLKKISKRRDDEEVLNLLIDIYKIHKKCLKYMNQKEALFTQLLVDVYRSYVQDKVERLPPHMNVLDLAIKLCLQEIAFRKNLEKPQAVNSAAAPNLGDAILGINSNKSTAPAAPRIVHIPGFSPRGRARSSVGKAASNTNITGTSLPSTESVALPSPPQTATDMMNQSSIMSMVALLGSTVAGQKDNPEFQKLVAGYYKKFMENSTKDGRPSTTATMHYSTGNLLPSTSLPPDISISTSSAGDGQAGKNTAVPMLCNDVTITPADVQPTASGNYDATQKNAADMPSSTTQSTIHNTASESNNLFVKPSCAQLKIKNLPDLPDSLTITTCPPYTATSPSTTASPSGKHRSKAKGSMKNKQAAKKPYARPNRKTGPTAAATIVSQQIGNLSAQADAISFPDLSTTTMTMTAATAAVTTKVQPKGSTKHNTASKRKTSKHQNVGEPLQHKKQHKQKTQQQHTTVALHSPFDFSSVDKNAVTMTPVPKATSTAPSLAHTTFVQPRPCVFPAPVTSTKTLQQKLAERQKANKLNESKKGLKSLSGSVEQRPVAEVIVLD